MHKAVYIVPGQDNVAMAVKDLLPGERVELEKGGA